MFKIMSDRVTDIPNQSNIIEKINDSKAISKLIGQMNYRPSIINQGEIK